MTTYIMQGQEVLRGYKSFFPCLSR